MIEQKDSNVVIIITSCQFSHQYSMGELTLNRPSRVGHLNC